MTIELSAMLDERTGVMAQFALRDIKPNPFRNMRNYPINPEKIERLRDSIRETTFWDNVVARRRDGYAEIAYGHHRLDALKKEYGLDCKVNLIVRDLDDETMIKIMANENMEEWGSSVVVEHETIKAVIEAYGKGLITLPELPPRTRSEAIRYAPSFMPDDPGVQQDHPYTAMAVAQFLGWTIGKKDPEPSRRVVDALAALQYEEQGILDSTVFAGLGGEQAHAVIVQTRKALREKEALAKIAEDEAKEAEKRAKAAQTAEEKKRHSRRRARAEEEAKIHRKRAPKDAGAVGEAVRRSFNEGKGVADAGHVAAKAKDNHRPKGAPQDINDYAEKLSAKLRTMLKPDQDDRVRRLDELVKYRQYLDDSIRKRLATELLKLSERAQKYADKFGGSSDEVLSGRVLDRHSIIEGTH